MVLSFGQNGLDSGEDSVEAVLFLFWGVPWSCSCGVFSVIVRSIIWVWLIGAFHWAGVPGLPVPMDDPHCCGLEVGWGGRPALGAVVAPDDGLGTLDDVDGPRLSGTVDAAWGGVERLLTPGDGLAVGISRFSWTSKVVD